MIEHSAAIVSTSVAEGFGLGFLEPWTFDKGLCGRNIPEITNDFSDLGIELDHLYERVETDLALLTDPTSLSMVLEGALKKDSITITVGKCPRMRRGLLTIQWFVTNGSILEDFTNQCKRKF